MDLVQELIEAYSDITLEEAKLYIENHVMTEFGTLAEIDCLVEPSSDEPMVHNSRVW